MVLTKTQRQELKMVYDLRPLTIAANALTYREFRRTVVPTVFGGVQVLVGGFWWGVEPDGYTHTTKAVEPKPPPKPRGRPKKVIDELDDPYSNRPRRPRSVLRKLVDATASDSPFHLGPILEFDGPMSVLFENGLHDGAVPTCNVLPKHLAYAAAQHDCVGVELAALGKPAGNIFEPSNHMYDSMRESSGMYTDGDWNYWSDTIFNREGDN